MHMDQTVCTQVKKPIALKLDSFQHLNRVPMEEINLSLFQHVNGNGLRTQQLNTSLKNVIKLPSLKGMMTKKMIGLPIIQTINAGNDKRISHSPEKDQFHGVWKIVKKNKSQISLGI